MLILHRNLTNANHMFFVAPLLAKSQYEFDSAMAQARARIHRYGQTKKIFIYHFVALHTIDVDILEHRHRRKNGISSSKSTMKLPAIMKDKKEKSKLVRNSKGEMALIPASWLADSSIRSKLAIGEDPGSFKSLINFSETFGDDDD